MAEDANIKIKFVSDTKDAESGVKKIIITLNDIPAASKKAGDSVKNTSDKIKNLPTVSDRASNALTNLNRVVQDAPYGFIGIANNLNPLLESFQRLKETSGSTGAALKALVSGLAGGGGIGIALAAITSALSFAQIGLSMWTRGMGEAKKGHEDLNKTVVKSEEVLTDYQKSLKQAIDAAASEGAKASILIGALSDSNAGLDERKTILSELTGISEKYFGSLDKEAASYKKANEALNDYNEGLVQSARIKALLPEYEKLFKKLLDAQIELKKNEELKGSLFGLSDEDFEAEQNRLKSFIRGRTNEITKAKEYLTQLAGGASSLEEILFGKKTTQAKTKEASDSLEKIIEDFKKFEFVSGQRALNEGTSETANRISAIKTALDRLFALGFNSKSKEVAGFVAELKHLEQIQAGVFAVKADVKIPELVPPETLTNLDRASEKVHKLAAEIQAISNRKTGEIISEAQLKKMQEFGQFVNTYLTAPIGDFFSTLMNGGQNALEAFGQMIKGIITKLIAAAISAAIFAAIVTAVFPASAAASGGFKGVFGQAMGLGNLLKGSATADGGIFSGPSMRLVGEYSGAKSNPEVISPLNKLKGLIADSAPRQNTTQTFVLRGVDLVASGERGNRFINR